jgi:5-methylcytosine-specific restriction endonuclease McrA
MVVLTNGGKLGHPDGLCFYCGRAVWKAQGRPITHDGLTKDHIIPKRLRFGRPSPQVKACFACNQDKKNLSLDEYRLLVAYRAGKIGLPEYKFAAERLPA